MLFFLLILSPNLIQIQSADHLLEAQMDRNLGNIIFSFPVFREPGRQTRRKLEWVLNESTKHTVCYSISIQTFPTPRHFFFLPRLLNKNKNGMKARAISLI